MNIAMKRLIRDEKGAAMVLAVILLLVGGLIATPLLAHMGTGLIAGEVYEKRTAELYAADAGVEDALWNIQHRVDVPSGGCNDTSRSYNISDVNGKSVHVTIDYQDGGTYKITSTAVTDDGGGTAAITGTAIESYVSALYMDFSSLLDNAIVSENNIIIKNGVSVTGNVTSGGTVDDKTKPGDIDGTITENAELTWPTVEQLLAYYGDDVEDLDPPFPYTHPLDIAGSDITLEALYRDGPWTIYNGSNSPATVTLSGTVYVTGDLGLGTEKQDFTLNLNGHTIFVEESISVGDKCTIIGSGCIVAIGDVYFAPKGDVGGENDFVLVMSVEGTTILQPSGTFYGCIAGDISVEVKSGTDATIINMGLAEGQGLDFPMGVGDDDELPPVTGLNIESWDISQL